MVTVEWDAPERDGGRPITEYVVVSYPDSQRETYKVAGGEGKGGLKQRMSVQMSGLSIGTAYTFTVYAVSSVSAGVASDPCPPVFIVTRSVYRKSRLEAMSHKTRMLHATLSNAKILDTHAPLPPTSVVAVVDTSKSEVVVKWEPPANTGFDAEGSIEVLSYTVVSYPEAIKLTVDADDSGDGEVDHSCVFAHLSVGVAYSFTVTATSKAGVVGDASARSKEVTLLAAPGAPVNVLARITDGEERIGFYSTALGCVFSGAHGDHPDDRRPA